VNDCVNERWRFASMKLIRAELRNDRAVEFEIDGSELFTWIEGLSDRHDARIAAGAYIAAFGSGLGS